MASHNLLINGIFNIDLSTFELTSVDTHNVPRLQHARLDPTSPSRFHDHWSQGQPVVVTECGLTQYGPSYFMKLFGGQLVDVENCEDTDDKTQMPLDVFFQGLGIRNSASGRGSIWKLKVRCTTSVRPLCSFVSHRH